MAHNKRLIAAAVLTGLLGCAARAAIVEVKTDAEYDREVRNAKGPVVVKFHADWCGACKGVAKPYKELADDPAMANVKFVSVDIDKIRPEKLGGVPAVFYFQDGKKVHDKLGGGRTFADDVRKDVADRLVIAQVEAKPAEEDIVEEAMVAEIPVVADKEMRAKRYDMPPYAGEQYDQPAYADEWQAPTRRWEEEAYPPVASRYAPRARAGRALQYEEEAVAAPDYGYAEEMFDIEEEPYMPAEPTYAEAYEDEMPSYGYTPPRPAPYRMPSRGGDEGYYPPPMPEPQPMTAMVPPMPEQEQTGIMGKVTSLIHGTVDLVADVLSAIWNAIMGLFGR